MREKNSYWRVTSTEDSESYFQVEMHRMAQLDTFPPMLLGTAVCYFFKKCECFTHTFGLREIGVLLNDNLLGFLQILFTA